MLYTLLIFECVGDKEGHVVTNYHVIRNAAKVTYIPCNVYTLLLLFFPFEVSLLYICYYILYCRRR